MDCSLKEGKYFYSYSEVTTSFSNACPHTTSYSLENQPEKIAFNYVAICILLSLNTMETTINFTPKKTNEPALYNKYQTIQLPNN